MNVWCDPSSANHFYFMMLNWLSFRNVKVLNLEVLADCAEDGLGNYLQRCGKHVLCAYLHAPILLPSFEKHCSNLTSLVACSGHSRCGSLRILGTNSNLEQLHLKDGFWKMSGLSEPMILHKLRQLKWSTTYGFNAELSCVTKAAPNLLQLALSTNSTDFYAYMGPIIIDVAHACPNLRTFSCKKLLVGPHDSFLKPFLVTCKAIVNLDVSIHIEMTDFVLIDALEVLRGLKSLNLIGCCKLTDHTLRFLAQHYASTLQVLYLGHQYLHSGFLRPEPQHDTYTAAGIASFRALCTHLHTFHYFVEIDAWRHRAPLVEACQRATIVDLKDEQMLPLVLKYCRQMQIMAITFSHFSNNLVRLTVEELMEVAERCPQLRMVIVEKSVSGVSKGEMDYSAVQQKFPNLCITNDMTMLDFDMLEIPV